MFRGCESVDFGGICIVVSSTLMIGMELSNLSDNRGLPLLRLTDPEDSGVISEDVKGTLSEVVEAEEVVFDGLVAVVDICFSGSTADGIVSVLRRLEAGSSSLESSFRKRLPADAAAASLRSNTGSVFVFTRLLKSERVDSSLGVTENAAPCAGRRRGHG